MGKRKRLVDWKKKDEDSSPGKKIFSHLTEILNTKEGKLEGFWPYEPAVIIENHLDFGEYTPLFEHSRLIEAALTKARETNNFNEVGFINVLNQVLSEVLKTRRQGFLIVSHLSILLSSIKSELVLDNVTIQQFSPVEIITKMNASKEQWPCLNKYCIIYSKVTDYNYISAYYNGINDIEFIRGLICLLANPYYQIGGQFRSLNKFYLGPVQEILSLPSYSKAEGNGTSMFDNQKAEPIKEETIETTQKWLASLHKLPLDHQKALKNSLARFAQALDNKDPKIAFILLWGALEQIALPENKRHDHGFISKRISFFYEAGDFIKEQIEGLIKYRNHLVHSGNLMSANSYYHLYKLQDFYKKFVRFSLALGKHFRTFQDFLRFCDTNGDINKLKCMKKEAILKRNAEERKIRFIDKVIKLSTPEDDQ